MNPNDIIARVEELGVKLLVIDGKLKALPPGRIPPELKAVLRERATEIKALLAAPVATLSTVPTEYDATTDDASVEPLCPRCHTRATMSRSLRSAWVCAPCGRTFMVESLGAGTPGMSTPLRRCDAPICAPCGAHSPTPHRPDCAFPRYAPCGSRWWWLSVHGALKCVACSAPASLDLVRGWVLAPEGDAPGEVLSLMRLLN